MNDVSAELWAFWVSFCEHGCVSSSKIVVQSHVRETAENKTKALSMVAWNTAMLSDMGTFRLFPFPLKSRENKETGATAICISMPILNRPPQSIITRIYPIREFIDLFGGRLFEFSIQEWSQCGKWEGMSPQSQRRFLVESFFSCDLWNCHG